MAIRQTTILDSLSNAVSPWIAAWERFGTAFAAGRNDEAANAFRDGAVILQCLQDAWVKWRSERDRWYTTEAEPWNRKVEPYRLAKYDPRYTPPRYDVGSDTPPHVEPDGDAHLEHLSDGPASAPRLILKSDIFEQVIHFVREFPGREAQLVSDALGQPEHAEEILAEIRFNRDRIAGMAMAFASTIMPANAVLSRVVETATTEQTVNDARRLIHSAPDELCNAARKKLELLFAERKAKDASCNEVYALTRSQQLAASEFQQTESINTSDLSPSALSPNGRELVPTVGYETGKSALVMKPAVSQDGGPPCPPVTEEILRRSPALAAASDIAKVLERFSH